MHWLVRLCETMVGDERGSTGQAVQWEKFTTEFVRAGRESSEARRTSGSHHLYHVNISHYCREDPNPQLVQFNYLSSYLVLFIWLVTTFLAVRW